MNNIDGLDLQDTLAMLVRSLVPCLLLIGCSYAVHAAESWPQWRGPHGNGLVTDSTPPLNWSADNVTWQVALPGHGQSSPVVWDDRIFLTSYEDRGAERLVFALDRGTGKLAWKQTAWKGSPEPSHQMNGWASATCATDGERVYAFFGRGGGLFCYTRDGEKLWDLPLGDFPGPWGTAACPVLTESFVIQNCDAEGDAKLIGVDKLTGKIVWSTPRENQRGWSTPLLIHANGKTLAVLNGHTGTRCYEAETGKELWFCPGFNGRGEPTVTPNDAGHLFVVNGLAGDVYAIRNGGSGNVGQSHRLWHTPRKSGRDLPSPAVVGSHLLVMAMKGILTCYSTADGAIEWEERVGGNFSASPVVADNKALFVSEDGEVVVVDPVATPHLARRNSVGPAANEIFRSSLAAHDGQWLLRSDKTLYCIGAKSK